MVQKNAAQGFESIGLSALYCLLKLSGEVSDLEVLQTILKIHNRMTEGLLLCRSSTPKNKHMLGIISFLDLLLFLRKQLPKLVDVDNLTELFSTADQVMLEVVQIIMDDCLLN